MESFHVLQAVNAGSARPNDAATEKRPALTFRSGERQRTVSWCIYLRGAMTSAMTHRADRGKIYVARANGSVGAGFGSRWFRLGVGAQMNPDDADVVALDLEHTPALPLWRAVTQIFYNVAFAAAAVRSF